MEIVLQWLDELDDLVFAGYAVWHRLRRVSLVVALAAAVAVHALPRFGIAAETVMRLLDVSLAALVVWLVVAPVSTRVARSRYAAAPGA